MVVKSRSVKRNAKNARGLGRDRAFFSPPPPPFPSCARLIFALVVLIRPHYTIWEPGTGYVQRSSCIKFMIVSFFNTEAFSLRIHEHKMKSGFLSSNGTEQSDKFDFNCSLRIRWITIPHSGEYQTKMLCIVIDKLTGDYFWKTKEK